MSLFGICLATVLAPLLVSADLPEGRPFVAVDQSSSLDTTIKKLQNVGPDVFEFLDLNRDGVVSREEFEQAQHNGLQVQPGIWKQTSTKDEEAEVAKTMVEVNQAACDGASIFNQSLHKSMKLTEQVYSKLVKSSMQVVAEEKSEAAAIGALDKLQKEVVEDLKACDAKKTQVTAEIQLYRQELEDLARILNSTRQRKDVMIRSLLARRSFVVHQSVVSVEEDAGIGAFSHAALRDQVDQAAQQLKICRQRQEDVSDETLTHSGHQQDDSCMDHEAHLNHSFSIAQEKIQHLLQLAQAKGQDSCHLAIMAQFETARSRLEGDVLSAQRRICAAFARGNEAADDLGTLKTTFLKTSDMLTGPCRSEQWQRFSAIVSVLAELVRSRPHPVGAAKTCKLLENADQDAASSP